MLTRVSNLATYISFILLTKKEKRNLFITTNSLHNSAFPSFNLFMFTEEDGTMINMETKIDVRCYHDFVLIQHHKEIKNNPRQNQILKLFSI